MVAQRSQAPRTRGAPLSHIRRPTPRHWAPPLRRPIQPRSPQFQTFPAGFVEAYAQMTGATDARPPAPPLFLLTARKPTETKRHPMSEPVHRLPRPRRSTGQSAPWHRPRARPCAQLLSQSAQHSQKPTEPPPGEHCGASQDRQGSPARLALIHISEPTRLVFTAPEVVTSTCTPPWQKLRLKAAEGALSRFQAQKNPEAFAYKRLPRRSSCAPRRPGTWRSCSRASPWPSPRRRPSACGRGRGT